MSVGEFVAFTIGWNLILEYVIGTSSVARGLSGYVDSLAGNQMSKFFNSTIHFEVSFLGDYPDFFSLVIVLLITALLAFGVKESSLLNNTFTSINVLTILLMFITGALKCKCSMYCSTGTLQLINYFIHHFSRSQELVDFTGTGRARWRR